MLSVIVLFFSDIDPTVGGIGIFKPKVSSLVSFVGVTVETLDAGEGWKRRLSWGSLQRGRSAQFYKMESDPSWIGVRGVCKTEITEKPPYKGTW